MKPGRDAENQPPGALPGNERQPSGALRDKERQLYGAIPDDEENRGEAMALRLRRTALGAGLGEEPVARIDRAFHVALERRARAFPEPDPQFLHPARTALILLSDVQLTDAGALEAAILFDSRFDAVSVGAEEAEALGFAGAAAYLKQFPAAGFDVAELLEALVVLDATSLAAVLAERLDHARHLHFTPAAEWPAFHRQILDVYLPVARRSGVLFGRFDAWAEAFGRRLARDRSIGR